MDKAATEIKGMGIQVVSRLHANRQDKEILTTDGKQNRYTQKEIVCNVRGGLARSGSSQLSRIYTGDEKTY
jgi:hypothetical protein